MVTIVCNKKFTKTERYLTNIKDPINTSFLDKYGQMGVDALREATPKDTGKTSESWYYKITKTKDSTFINWYNDNFNDGVPIAIVLQYGHATRNGGFVKGIDYINPALKPIFEQIASEAWKEALNE